MNETQTTAAQIRTLRNEALAAGDYAQVDLCDRALVLDGETTDQDGNEIALADMSQEDAILTCTGVILAARQADLLATLADLDDGTGTLGIVVDQALADDPAVTVASVREIVTAAIQDARAEAVRS